MSQPFKLYRLQQIDSQLDRGRNRLHEINKVLQDDAALRQARQNIASSEQKLQSTRKALLSSEWEVNEQHIKIEQSESSLYGGKIRNPKELQDLQNEVAALKRYLTVLEDRQLDDMLALEEAENELEHDKQVMRQVEAQASSQNALLLQEQDNLLKEIQNQETERQAVISSIPREELILYDQLRKMRNGVAVARVTDRACSACGSTLSASLLSTARSANQITRCASCGRILYAG
jgi:predicted  nucleic acid-binding Zn-ribbon protein